MAKIKNMLEDIVILRLEGFSCEHIATQLDVPIDWTYGTPVDDMIQEHNELDRLYGGA